MSFLLIKTQHTPEIWGAAHVGWSKIRSPRPCVYKDHKDGRSTGRSCMSLQFEYNAHPPTVRQQQERWHVSRQGKKTSKQIIEQASNSKYLSQRDSSQCRVARLSGLSSLQLFLVLYSCGNCCLMYWPLLFTFIIWHIRVHCCQGALFISILLLLTKNQHVDIGDT